MQSFVKETDPNNRPASVPFHFHFYRPHQCLSGNAHACAKLATCRDNPLGKYTYEHVPAHKHTCTLPLKYKPNPEPGKLQCNTMPSKSKAPPYSIAFRLSTDPTLTANNYFTTHMCTHRVFEKQCNSIWPYSATQNMA